MDACWKCLQFRAKLPDIGKDVDDAMVALVERDNARSKGTLNKSYGRADLDKHRLGELNDLTGRLSWSTQPAGQRIFGADRRVFSAPVRQCRREVRR